MLDKIQSKSVSNNRWILVESSSLNNLLKEYNLINKFCNVVIKDKYIVSIASEIIWEIFVGDKQNLVIERLKNLNILWKRLGKKRLKIAQDLRFIMREELNGPISSMPTIYSKDRKVFQRILNSPNKYLKQSSFVAEIQKKITEEKKFWLVQDRKMKVEAVFKGLNSKREYVEKDNIKTKVGLLVWIVGIILENFDSNLSAEEVLRENNRYNSIKAWSLLALKTMNRVARSKKKNYGDWYDNYIVAVAAYCQIVVSDDENLSHKCRDLDLGEEVQEGQESQFLDVVHQQIEKKRFRFALTGSSARKLKRGAANLLAGRALQNFLYPLTHFELGTRFNLDFVLQWGSLPLIFELEESERRDYLNTYVATYLKEEIRFDY